MTAPDGDRLPATNSGQETRQGWATRPGITYPQQPPAQEADAVALANERVEAIWEPCENDNDYDDARMELFLAFSAEERRAALVRSVADDLGITPKTAAEARLLDIARELAGLPEREQPPAQERECAHRKRDGGNGPECVVACDLWHPAPPSEADSAGEVWPCCGARRPGLHTRSCPAHAAVTAWLTDDHGTSEITAWEHGWTAGFLAAAGEAR